MRRALLLAMPVTASACRGVGGSGAPRGGGAADSAGAQVVSLERRIRDAERRRDRAAVGSLLAPDHVYLSSIARRDRSKAEDRDDRFGPHVALGGYELETLRTARVAPAASALHFIARQRIRTDSVVICPHAGTSETWARRGGRWLLVTRTEYLIGGERPPPCPAGSAT